MLIALSARIFVMIASIMKSLEKYSAIKAETDLHLKKIGDIASQ